MANVARTYPEGHRLTDARHVESVEEGLNRAVDMSRFSVALEFEDALSDGRDDGVMSSLDVGQQTGEAIVIVVHFGRPREGFVGLRVISKGGASRITASVPSERTRDHADPLTDAGVAFAGLASI